MKLARTHTLFLLAGALAACDQSPTASDPAQQTGEGTLVGRIESGSTSGSLSPSYDLSYSLSGSGAGLTVAAARVKADGALEVLSSASAAADGSYRIEKIPAGESRLVVVASSSSGAEVGRVIVHQEVSAGGAATVAPVNGETTVEGLVFSELVRSGMPAQAINTVELAQSIEVSAKTTADALVQSTSDLRALAEGYKTRQETYTQVLANRGTSLDAKARFQAALPAAVSYAQERHAGAEERASEAKASAEIADAYKANGVSNQTQAEASSAAETGFVRAAAVANANARLDIARTAVTANLAARERAIAETHTALGLGAAAVDAAKQALAQAQASVSAATSAEAIAEAAAQASASIQAGFEASLAQSGRIPNLSQTEAKAAFQNLPSQADLEVRLGAATSANAVASAHVEFFNGLRTAVQTAVSQLAANGGGVDGKATADLFVGLRAGVSVR